MQIISRLEAKAAGLNRYFTGKACKHGHVAERYEKNNVCIACSKTHRKEYSKNYYINNRNHLLQKSKEYSDLHKEEASIRAKNWKLKNKERSNELSRIGRSRNIEKSKANKKKWSDKNTERINFLTAKRRANKKLATPKWADLKKILFIYEQKPKGLCVDHIVPLQSDIVCGLHNEFNLQYLTRPENSKKSNIYWPDMP